MSSLEHGSGVRFSEYTSTNHQMPIWVVTSISLTYSLIFLIIRFSVKFKSMARDDAILGFGYILATAQWGFIYGALHEGVGKSVSVVDSSGLTSAGKLVFASRLTTILTIGASQCTVLFFLRCLFPSTSTKDVRLCNYLNIAAVCFCLVSALVITAGCSPSRALEAGGTDTCVGEGPRWIAVATLESFIEISLFVLPAYLFSQLHMPFRTKVLAATAFAFRLGNAALLISYTTSHLSFLRSASTNTNIGAVHSLLWQQGMLAYSLISATIPCLRTFFHRFRTDDLARLNSQVDSAIEMHIYKPNELSKQISDPERCIDSAYSYSPFN